MKIILVRGLVAFSRPSPAGETRTVTLVCTLRWADAYPIKKRGSDSIFIHSTHIVAIMFGAYHCPPCHRLRTSATREESVVHCDGVGIAKHASRSFERRLSLNGIGRRCTDPVRGMQRITASFVIWNRYALDTAPRTSASRSSINTPFNGCVLLRRALLQLLLKLRQLRVPVSARQQTAQRCPRARFTSS